jgi:hypothetical protein
MVTIYEDQTNSKKEESSQEVVSKENLPIMAKIPEVVSESLVKEKESPNPTAVTEYFENFLQNYEEKLKSSDPGDGPTVKVSEVLGGIARVYEKIRTTIEYKGEHVIRRNAIERILKRRVWEQGTVKESVDEKRVSESLVKELVWARYLKNESVTKDKVVILSKVIGKYLYFLRNLDNVPEGVSNQSVRLWIWGVASSEIEDILDPSYRELFVKLMYDWFTSKFVWTDESLDEHEKEIQIYLSIHRSFPKSDEPIMRYHLLLKEIPGWREATNEQINKFILNFNKIYSEIEGHLTCSDKLSLYRKIQKQSPVFEIFREIAQEEKLNLRNLVADKEKFEEKIRNVCAKKYTQIRNKVSTGIVRSIIYIFITKVVLAMLVEVPYEIFKYGDVRYIPLGINVIFPPIMMWVIGMSTKIPGAKNTEAVVSRLKSAVYDKNISRQSFSTVSSDRNKTLSNIFAFIYLILFTLVFGVITYLLTLIDFSIFGILVFFVFLSLVVLFAFRVRYNAVQLRVESDKESFIDHVTTYLMLPFLNAGFYLSKGLAKINFLSVIFDFIIEAPLKSIIEIFEEWTSFIREKREEVIETPE